MRIGERIRRIEEAEKLDQAVAVVKRMVDRVPEGRLRDVLHGVQLGHPAHPLLVQVPIGVWTSALLLDLMPGARRPARVLVNVGLLAAVPAALAGAVDWSRMRRRHQRVGIVHAAANDVGILLFGASSLARARGRDGLGRALAMAGMGAVGLGGMLGAHIAYYRTGGANHADHLVDLLPSGWHGIGRITDFPDGKAARADLGDVPLAVVRRDRDVHVLVGTCAHMGGPLFEGEVDGDCLRCPWHGSAFRTADGVVAHGPATAAQQALEVSVHDGAVSVRRPPRLG
ncbi:Rieske 2Fe-2S domain-containing protein [Actinorugispora endophytica]|uniref:Nitrite reductase/ring-hydroxylating ferredoxin subunit n=1 Tax=Actinorugispora endophytica TaxID=1605990 RepID=A0A4R6V5V4_9ACTN|nr:Rieske (2Fe-2S) protein [Actinorugispora endophytica]TDQ51574.1 nitrite reductase/ring-hydroxylating ferredoxin subunit [Actinorugispora endophytica]